MKQNSGIELIKRDFNFQEIFKVSKESKYLSTIQKLIRFYFEAGFLDRIFKDIHKREHK